MKQKIKKVSNTMTALIITFSLILVSLIGLTMAWFTDKKNYSSNLDFGDVSILVDDTTTEDKTSDSLIFSIYRSGTKLDAGKKVMPGDELRATLRITNKAEDCYYLVTLNSDNDILGDSFNSNYYVNNSTLYAVRNLAGDIYYTLIDESNLQVFSVDGNNNETLVGDGEIVGQLTNTDSHTLNISQKISEDLTKEQLNELSITSIKVNCNVYAIQQANISKIDAYKQLTKMRQNDVKTEKQLLSGEQLIKDNNFAISKLTTCYEASIKYFGYQNYQMFEGKTITRIDIPVKSVSAIDENQTFTIRKINSLNAKVIETYTLKVPYSQIEGLEAGSINKFIRFENLSISVGVNETLYFGKSDTDTVIFGYGAIGNNSEYYIAVSISAMLIPNSLNKYHFCLPFNIYYVSNLENDNTSSFAGKYVSILGDSISTYTGYINNQNSTTSGNGGFYGSDKLSSVNDTYWMQVINSLNMKFCVNNSWSGTTMSGLGTCDNNGANGGYNRANQLHDDTTSDNPNNEVINPDVILLNMGINDCALGLTCGSLTSGDFATIQSKVDSGSFTATSFAEAYVAGVYKMTKAYPNAKIYCLNIPYRNAKTDANLNDYNKVISQVVNYYTNAHLVDIHSSTKLYGTSYEQYTVANASSAHDNIHPNAIGMDIISDLIIKEMLKYGA